MPHLDIPARPRLRPWYTVAKGDDGRLIIHYADVAIVMRGKSVDSVLPVLLPLLDGTRTVEQIIGEFAAAEPEARAALQQFSNFGLLMPGPCLPAGTGLGSAATVDFLVATTPNGETLLSELTKLERLRITIAGMSRVGALIRDLLRSSGLSDVQLVSLAEAAGGSIQGFVLAAPADDELLELPAWNKRALQVGVAWMQVLPFDGRFSAIGPVFVPGETCCYECFLMRRESNVGYPDEFRTLQGVVARRVWAPPLDAAIAGISAMFLIRWLMRYDATLPGRFFAFETGADDALVAHHVLRVPRCPACSTVARAAAPSPWFDAVS